MPQVNEISWFLNSILMFFVLSFSLVLLGFLSPISLVSRSSLSSFSPFNFSSLV